MRIIHMPFYLIILLLSLSAPALAETSDEPSPDRWYDIEVLIFAQQPEQGENGNKPEVWPLDPGSPDLKQVIELAPPLTQEPSEDSTQPPLPFAERPLTSWRIGHEDKRIRSGHDYTLLSHQAWRQPAPPSEVALPVHIRVTPPMGTGIVEQQAPPETLSPVEPVDAPPSNLAATSEPEEATNASAEHLLAPLIEGIIRISRNNYLHVDADLLYRTETARIDGLPVDKEQTPLELPPSLIAANDIERPLTAGEMQEDVAPTQFRMRQSRRVRKGELNYFDHPRFGLLIRVDPVELPVDTPPAQ